MRWFLLSFLSLVVWNVATAEPTKPNIVWIVAEDMSPNIAALGDQDAITPNLDKFSQQSVAFTRCFTHAPVCAPSRSGLITGMYPTTIGTHHMRSTLLKPPPLFTDELKKVGYQINWPGKTDFNFAVPKGAFDSTVNWMNKGELKPPFFAYMNLNITHESQIRAPKATYEKNTAKLTAAQRRDRAKVKLPPYYPDTPEVRNDVATYHENITAMDIQFSEIIKWLDDKKLADNTIVVFFGDHGWGMSRGKRWLYDSGIHAPLLIRWPGKLKPQTIDRRLVAFIDFAPTMLNVAGATIPVRLQGQPFLNATGEIIGDRKYVFAARDRMDETFDRIRSVRDQRYKYIRNFYPQLPYAQHILYMDEMPTMQTWRKLNAEGKLVGPQKLFFAPTKPAEELYDTENDPHEINNLAANPDHAEKLKQMRAVLDKWIIDTKDLGEKSEADLIKQGLVQDRLSTEYADRIKQHPKTSKASNLPPK